MKADLIAFVNKSDNWRLDLKNKKKVLSLLAAVAMPGDTATEDPEEYSLSATPVDLIDDVKAALDGEQKKYIFVSPDAASTSRKSILINFKKGLLKATCSVVIRERNVEIKNISNKLGRMILTLVSQSLMIK